MYKISYCSNVHAGATLTETRQNLASHALEVKQRFSPNAEMGVGLWLSNAAATELLQDLQKREDFKTFLDQSGIETFTFNGFPFGNFHQPVVKHAVYQPTWFDEDRLRYTRGLAELIQQFSGTGPASISTLPIAWGTPGPSKTELDMAVRHLRDLAAYLGELRKTTGQDVYVCLEPEPGCILQTSQDVVNFFENHLLAERTATGRVDEAEIRHHIRVCHDVCHSVVMCESQTDALDAYHRAGIFLGKAQISSAVWVDFDQLDATARKQAFAELSSFAEDRYLHQTTIQLAGQAPRFLEDLPLALKSVECPEAATGIWRIHFHVPVYLQRFGHLRASQQEILDFLSICRSYSDVQHFEVETYAWNVLPRELQQDKLSDGIAEEMSWFREMAQQHLGAEEASSDEA